jgi:ribonucleoside-diphosphate reductase alpha chain
MMTEIDRTPHLDDAYPGVEFALTSAERKDFKTGKISFSARDIMMPAHWDHNAVDIHAEKYFRRKGVPDVTVRIHEDGVPEWLQRSEPAEGATFGGETDARQTFRRLAGCWTYWGWKGGYFGKDEATARAFYDALRLDLAKQHAAPNSPQWFNTGLHWAYGIAGLPEGHWFVDNNGIPQQSTSKYERIAGHACFIVGMKDDLLGPSGIMDTLSNETRIFKSGSGSGMNASRLRGKDEPLSAGGKSSGMMSFLKTFDANAGSIKSGGTTRRAAKMVCVDADHPEIETFIEWKVVEESKVAALVTGSRLMAKSVKNMFAAIDASPLADPKERHNPKSNAALRTAMRDARDLGVPLNALYQILELKEQTGHTVTVTEYDTGWTSEAYESVAGQNANNSVRLTDEFMSAVENNGDWHLTGRVNGDIIKTISARELNDKIAVAAWRCADPGLHYTTTIQDWATCPEDGPIRASNPCSEYLHNDNTACNLASLNLVKFIDNDRDFNVERFVDACTRWTTVLDITNDMAHLPSRDIAVGTSMYRTIGLGYANLGALLMRFGYAYDSENGRGMASALTALMTGTAYRTSAEMAKQISPFPRYEANKKHVHRVLRNHLAAVKGDTGPLFYENVSTPPTIYIGDEKARAIRKHAYEIWLDAIKKAENHGVRNAQVSLIAPTGTIGILMGCDTTGPEPDFALIKFKSLAGGGNMKIVNASVRPALKNLAYSEDLIAGIEDYLRGVPTLTAEERKRLSAAGIPNEKINKIVADLPDAFNFRNVAWSNGIDLSSVGFTEEELEAIDIRTCGYMTIEGAPGLKEEHLAVFDCATPSGAHGTRYIAPEGHLKMLAAIQPFISGASSKTVNLPKSATVQDIKNVYAMAHKLAIKAVALYRDGSKLSQPLMTALEDLEEDMGANVPFPTTSAQGVNALGQALARKKRPMPKRRHGITQEFTIGGHKIFLTTGEYEDGTPGEIFLNMSKEGAAFRALMNNFAIAVSVGLQWGVPLEEFVDKFVGTRFEPLGAVAGHEHIKFASSLLDAVFRELGMTYLHDYSHANIPPAENILRATELVSVAEPAAKTSAAASSNGHVTSAADLIREAKQRGYTGDPCQNEKCNAMTLVVNGSCKKCETCGETTGCS